MYRRYSRADSDSVLGECTAGTVVLIVIVYWLCVQHVIGADRDNVVGKCSASTLGRY